MVEVVLQIIANGLPILDKLIPDEATKIRNRVLEYRRQWDAEMAKGAQRDDANLDMLERELLDICQLFSSQLATAASKNS